MARDLNRAQLIGRLTRDPELRYTPSGSAVCSFGVATNRSWTTDTGEKREEVDFHNIVAWNKLAEICSQYLTKGRRVYVEGRLTTRSWTSQDNQQKTRTEIVLSDMIMLDGKGASGGAVGTDSTSIKPGDTPSESGETTIESGKKAEKKTASTKKHADETETKVAENSAVAPGDPPAGEASTDEEVSPDDIPF